jgi:DNA-directed RNA polymerase specialized sigma24 family protein
MNDDIITQLYISQMSIIYKYLIKLGCSKHEAEDIVQESFTRAMEHMDGVRSEKLRSWLFTVAINIFRTF